MFNLIEAFKDQVQFVSVYAWTRITNQNGQVITPQALHQNRAMGWSKLYGVSQQVIDHALKFPNVHVDHPFSRADVEIQVNLPTLSQR